MTHYGIIMGSPCYIAPELWHGHANTASVSVDIYSLAVMIYRMLGGHPPFETQSLVEMRELATAGKRPRLTQHRPDLSEHVDEWVERALAADPTERYQSVRDLWEALCEIVEQPKPSSWSIIPRAVAAGLHPRRVAEALRRAGAVLWGRSRDSEPGVTATALHDDEGSGPPAIGRPARQRPLMPPKHVMFAREAEGPVSEAAPITVIPMSLPLSSRTPPALGQHQSTAATIRERSKRRKKTKRRRVHQKRKKARRERRKSGGKK
jgi:serine/threonine protein kinase